MSTYLANHPSQSKPALPYVVGHKLRAQIHHPDPPPDEVIQPATGDFYDHKRDYHPARLCHIYPPSDGRTGIGSVELKIIDRIVAGDCQSAQILKARVQQSTLKSVEVGQHLVAKFYDPMYWDLRQGGCNNFGTCDSHYRYESEAYRRLKPLYGAVVPRFYGSFTVVIPSHLEDTSASTAHPKERHVRMILMEFVQGQSLLQANPTIFTKRDRRKIMAGVVYAKTVLEKYDVLHGDVYQRNFILEDIRDESHAASQNRIRVIDFETADCGFLSGKNKLPQFDSASTLSATIQKRWEFDRVERIIERFERWHHDWTSEWNEWLTIIVDEYKLDPSPKPGN